MRWRIVLILILLFNMALSLSLIKGGISVLYRTVFPTDYLDDPMTWIQYFCDSSSPNKHIRSNVGSSIDSFPVTLQYSDGKWDFFNWHVIDPNQIPQDSIIYVYFYYSQIAVSEGGKCVIFTFLQYDQIGVTGVGLVIDGSGKIWTVNTGGSYDDPFQEAIEENDDYDPRVDPVTIDPSSQLIIVLKLKYIDIKHIHVYNLTVIQNNTIVLNDYINADYNTAYDGVYFTVVACTKYQLTLEDAFVSYDAPDVLLSSGGETGGDVPQEPPPGGGETPTFIYPPPPNINVNVTAPPTWLYILFDLVKQGRMVEATYYLYSWALGGYMFFIALLVVLGSFSCYLRGGLTAVSVFLLLTGALLYVLLPPEIHTMAQIIIILGIAILLYKVVTNE